MKKSIFKNSAFNVAYKLLNVLFPMITAVYVARVLMPAGVGKVSYAQNILTYFVVVASLGIPTYGARELARILNYSARVNKLFSELSVINFFSTLVCSVAYIALIFVVPSFRNEWALYVVSGIQLFLNIFNVDWFYTGNEEYVYITIRSTLIKVVSIICLFLFVKNRDDYVTYALINSLAVSSNYLLNVCHLRGRVSLTFKKLNFEIHIRPILILLLTNLATDLYNQIDVTMLGLMCTDDVVGYYSYAIRLVRIVTTVSTAIAITTLPRMSQYYIENKTVEFNKLFNKTLNAVITIVLPCMVGIVLVSNSAVRIVYGESFAPSASILRMLSPIFIIVAISYECGSIVLTATNNEKYLLIATLSGAATNIMLNSLLIPISAGTGAAIASVCAECVVMVIHIYFSRKYIQFNIQIKDLISIVMALIGMIILVVFIQKVLYAYEFVSFLTSVCFGALIYFFILSVLKNSIMQEVIKKIKQIIGIKE